MINGAVYNPATTRTATCTDGSTKTVRDPFPNNFIGAPSTWDPVAQKVLAYMPTPSGPTANALNNNYPNLQPNNKYQYLTSIKIDHYIGQKWHLSGYYIAEYSDKDNADDGINTVAGSTRWNTTQRRSCISCKLYSHTESCAPRRNGLQRATPLCRIRRCRTSKRRLLG